MAWQDLVKNDKHISSGYNVCTDVVSRLLANILQLCLVRLTYVITLSYLSFLVGMQVSYELEISSAHMYIVVVVRHLLSIYP